MSQPHEPDDVKRVPDVDLGGIFGNRTEGLTGLAPRRRSSLRSAPETAEAPSPATAIESTPDPSETQVAVAPDRGTRRPAAPPRARGIQAAPSGKTATGSAAVRLVIVQLPDRIADRLRDDARSRGVTYKELILDAVEACVDQLAELIARRQPPAREAGSLFAGERTALLSRPEGRRQVSIKLSEGSIAALDSLATKCGAASRSELVATALEAYLVRSTGD